jgi:hypothetical protein
MRKRTVSSYIAGQALVGVAWFKKLSARADADRRPVLAEGLPQQLRKRQRRASAMATHPDLPSPITPDLPVAPDEGPSTPPDEPTDPEPPPTTS